ncbi:MAG TPA: GNAT family N-acetyltransferase [Pseudomonadales bacterium]|nr:GNAT family N-acetyltransferase [Pseudomonadales bacterium]
MTEGVHVRRADWDSEETLVRSLRNRVFVREQQVPQALEWDGQDEDAVHLLAFDHRGDAIGTARLLPSGQIGRMAVLPERRGFGIGRALLDAAVQAARDRGDYEVFLNAQTHALGFYEAAGFRATGDTFEEAGIAHQRMDLALGIAFEPPAVGGLEVVKAQAERKPYELPGLDECSREVVMLEGPSEVRDAIVQLCSHARRELQILSPELDPKLFDDAELVEILSNFARRHEQSRVTILIHDSRRMVQDGHRLLELSRRLSTSISIRLVHPDMRDREDTLVVADRIGLVNLPRHGFAQGFLNLNDSPLANQYARLFERLHDHAQFDPHLRTLSI